MGLRGRFRAFVDSIIPPQERSPNPLIYRTAFLRIALLTVLSFIGSIAALMYSIMDFSENDFAVALSELLVGILLFLTPFIARKYKNIDALATLAILLFGSVFIVAIFDELPEDKSSFVWLSVVPALSFVLKGRRGIYWSAGYLLVHFIFVLIAGKLWTESLLDAYLSYSLVTVIFYFYAWMSERYREVWERIARTDNLTGILNRIAFEEILSREVENARKNGEPLSLVIFDIDNFKQINDTYGHPFGDRVIKKVASIALENLGEADIIARWGGEEFIILMPGKNLRRAVAISDKIRRKIQSYRFKDELMVTASFGVAQLTRDDDVPRLVLRADKALYQAKREGKNKVRSFMERIDLK